MESFNNIITSICDMLWGAPMIILLFGTHLFLSIRLKFPQRKIWTAIKLSFAKDDENEGEVSQFGALATALAATIGTGNIVGVGTAIALGGPGAVLWCWLTGIFGIATKYSEGLLAVKYRKKSESGHMLGGPMYALEYGLHCKWAGILFAIFTAVAAFGIGCTVQSNAISTLTCNVTGISPWITAIIVTVFTALVLIGGIRIIAKVCCALVPFMAIIYVLGCIVILCINHEYLWPAIKAICEAAFNPEATGAGFVGGSIITAARYGIARGLFSNESGLGSAPLVAAAAKTRNPVRQALVSASGTFWDTVVICAITGIVIVSSVIRNPDISYVDGGQLTTLAFDKIPYVGEPLLLFGLVTFAFTTILGWCLYGQRAMEYLAGYKAMKVYTWVFVAFIFIGGVMELGIVWTIADTFNALMAIPNLAALILLSGVIAKETNKYLWGNQLDMKHDNSDKE